MFCFLNTGHVIILFRTASFKFCLVHVQMDARNDKKTKCQVPLGPLLRKQNIQAKEVYTSQSSATRKTGGGYSRNVDTGRLRPEVQPLYQPLYHFSQKRYPFRISSIDKWYPFHIPCLELWIPFNRCK